MSAGEAAAPTPRWSVAVTGATGFIGSALVESLREDGHRVVRVTHSPAKAGPHDALWDPAAGTIDARRLEGLDAVVNLAGENLGERWTGERRKRIRVSRVEGTRLLAGTLSSLADPPRVLVNASAVGYYGDRGDERLDEDSAPGDDFLARLVRDWEAATEPAEAAGIRVVRLRSGAAMGVGGGMLARLLLPFRLGVGARMGSGRQWLSWIALPDLVDAIRFAIGTAGLRGPVNTVAPEPVTNREFTRALGRALRRPAPFVLPAPALHLAFGEMADATILASQRAVPDRLLGAGFVFRYPGIEEALRAELG